MNPLPAFYHRRAVAEDSAVLGEGEGFFCRRSNGVVAIDCSGPWRPEFEEAYRRHGAFCVHINTFLSSGWEGRSLEFLRRLPGIRQLSLNLHHAMDLTPVGDLEGLESLSLGWNAPGSPGKVDFSSLVQLRECCVGWQPAFEPILGLESLRILSIGGMPRREVLDLTGLPRLAELDLRSCRSLKQVVFEERSQIVALESLGCGKLRPDWPGLAPHLRYLSLGGRIGFAAEDLAAAGNLEFLWAEVPGGRSWEVLRDLPRLKGIRFVDLKITAEVAGIVRSINQANGHGPTLAARPPRHVLSG